MGRPEFTESMISKAEKLVDLGLVEYKGDGVWFTKPIAGYNKSPVPHRVRAGGDFEFSCDCQGYQIKEAKYRNLSSSIYPVCSHIAAVKLFLQRQRQREKLDKNQSKFDFIGEEIHGAVK